MISIVSAIWQREKLTEIFLDSLVRYRKDYGFTAMIAGSEQQKTREMCQSREIGYVEVNNRPLSRKFNLAANRAAEKYNPKAFLILGSDDFVDDRLIKKYLGAINGGADIVGIRDCYFYDTQRKEGSYWKGYTNFRQGETIGMARMLSRKVFQKLGGKFWPLGIETGLDYNMTKRLKRHTGFLRKEFSIEGMMAVDIKGQGNISEYDCYLENMVPVKDDILETIPEFERIKKL